MKSIAPNARIGSPKARWLGLPVFKTIRITFYLIFGLLVAGQVLGDLLKFVRSFKASGLADELAPFDSFSEPALAARVLKQETDRLLFAYTVARDEARDARLLSNDEGGNAQGQRTSVGEVQSLANLREESPPLASTIERMQHLQSELTALDFDLRRRLTSAYYDHHLWAEFLDGYLRLLYDAPNWGQVVCWERCALEAAQACGRTEEISRALRHAIEFRASIRTARGLKGVLEEWQNQLIPAPEVGKR
jgi:hypothetical protein